MRKILFFFLCCTVKQVANAQDDTYQVIFISTNDVHGQIDNFPKMAAYVRALRKEYKDVFVCNAGDLFNGNPVVDQAKEKGYPLFDLMNDVPYDLSCPGNHEFEFGEIVLRDRIRQSSSAWICANLQRKPTSVLDSIPPYRILKTSAGTSIAVIGLSASSSNPCLIPGIQMESPVKAALRYKGLKDSANVLMALTHIGYKADSILASSMQGLDLIIGGHSHTMLPEGKLVNGTLITQAGDKMQYFGKTVLTIRNHKVVSKTFELIDVSRLAETDAAVQEKVKTYTDNPGLKKIAGSSGGFANKEAIGCLKTDALRDILKLDIAFDHARNISWSDFPEGNITVGNIYEWDSYDYHTLRYDLTPAQIRSLILQSLANTQIPVLFVSGIHYTIQKKEGLQPDIILQKDGVLLDENKIYSVGVNSFIACQYMKDITARSIDLKTSAAEALIQYLQTHPKVDYQKTQRVFVR